jgi:hypothetical protein
VKGWFLKGESWTGGLVCLLPFYRVGLLFFVVHTSVSGCFLSNWIFGLPLLQFSFPASSKHIKLDIQIHPLSIMDGGILKFLVPKIPSLANTTLWHTLGLTETSNQWDLRTALTVQVLRSVMSGGSEPTPVGKVQASTLKEPGIKGNIWVAKATISAPKEDQEGIREAVFHAIDEMAEGDVEYTRPGLVDTEVEWTGFRHDAGKKESMPDISEAEKYQRLMAEPTRTSETTILYFHGGAYYLCDPSTHRAITSRLAKESNGRVCSVRYRLAPQAAFPSQLLDALMVYLSLIYPPPGSLHSAVPASNIVLAGDSAGGNLVFALLQLLLQLHRSSPNNSTPHLLFHGSLVAVPRSRHRSSRLVRHLPRLALHRSQREIRLPPTPQPRRRHLPLPIRRNLARKPSTRRPLLHPQPARPSARVPCSRGVLGRRPATLLQHRRRNAHRRNQSPRVAGRAAGRQSRFRRVPGHAALFCDVAAYAAEQ